jgi:hypothetical protein
MCWIVTSGAKMRSSISGDVVAEPPDLWAVDTYSDITPAEEIVLPLNFIFFSTMS